jgi:glutamate synthase (NADPH/NADH) small chain
MSNASKCLEWKRQDVAHRPVDERIRDFFEIEVPLPEPDLIRQAGRCMDCGVPFCHGSGCPLGNLIPDMNDFLSKSKWRAACDILHSTNNFPEITGRICPASVRRPVRGPSTTSRF